MRTRMTKKAKGSSSQVYHCESSVFRMDKHAKLGAFAENSCENIYFRGRMFQNNLKSFIYDVLIYNYYNGLANMGG